MRKKPLITILIAIILAVLVGILVGPEKKIFGITFYSIFDLFGNLFINALMIIVVPLIASSIITGISKIGKKSSFKSIGLKTFSLFILTNILALTIGVLLVNIFKEHLILSSQKIGIIKIDSSTLAKETLTIRDVILQIIPRNILKAFSETQILGIIFFSILFGFVISKIKPKYSEILKNFFESIFHSMLKFTQIIMKFLPLGVFFLIAREFSKTGFSSVKALGVFSSLVLSGIAIHFFFTIPLLLILIAKINPIKHLKAMTSPLITAFSTSSSSASLPVLMDSLEKNVKVSDKICGIVTPLGSSINLSASAMYVFIASCFIATIYNVDLNFTTQATIFLLSLVTTLGVAAIPSGSIIIVVIILGVLGIPASSIGFIMVVDRFLDMFRTPANIFTISSSTVMVAKLEGEKIF
jgi:Na+/H+-dicarboxylate symporter